jgi:hypothetical protein
MTDQTQAQAALARELARLRRLRKQPIHPGYAAIVAQAHSLGLPHLYATDITIHDRLLIAERQPRQFAWLLHEGGSLLSTPEPNERPLDYLHATRRMYGHALPFWRITSWDQRRRTRHPTTVQDTAPNQVPETGLEPVRGCPQRFLRP